MTKNEKLYLLSMTRYFSSVVVSELVYFGALSAEVEQIKAVFSVNRHCLLSFLEQVGQLAKYKLAVLGGQLGLVKEYREKLDVAAFVLFDSADFVLSAAAAGQGPATGEDEPGDVAVGLGLCFLLRGKEIGSLIEVRAQVPHAHSKLSLGDRTIADFAFTKLMKRHKVFLPPVPPVLRKKGKKSSLF